MSINAVMTNIKDNQVVRIDGRAYVAGGTTDSGRRFTERETGDVLVLNNAVLMRMAREQRITSETMHESLSKPIVEGLARDFDGFTDAQRLVATRRKRMIDELEKSRSDRWHWKSELRKAIDAIETTKGAVAPGTATEPPGGDDAGPAADDDAPEAVAEARKATTTRSLRRWHLNYVASGRDIRSLIDYSTERGSRDAKLPDWAIEAIDKAIRQVHATANQGSLAATYRRAVTLLRERMAKDDLSMPDFGQKNVLGKNAVRRRLRDWETYDVVKGQVGKAEADRIMTAVGVGPQGERPMSEVEVDHTLLDIVVVGAGHGQIYGRPWLTTFMDRYSRCIVGFAITFHPPSWTSLMGALRNAVEDKSKTLAELGGIHCTWDCMGVPEELYCDNGKDFHSTSMRETQAVLSMRVVYLPRKKGWLKGKMERWYKTLEEQVIHLMPGTTFSNVLERKHYDSAEMAVMTIQQLNWIVTKWIVDVYHQTEHSALGETPAERWREGILENGPKLPPPAGLIKPLTGLVIRGALTRSGVQYKDLRWNSNAFSGLMNRQKDTSDVQIRIDTQDLRLAYVYDENRRKWIECDLETKGEAEDLSLHQYLVVRSYSKKIRLPDETAQAALSRAHGEMYDYVEKIRTGGKKAEKRFARFIEDGRKPSEHIVPGAHDSNESRNRLGAHDLASTRPRLAGRPAMASLPAPDPRSPASDAIAPPTTLASRPPKPPTRAASGPGGKAGGLTVRFRPIKP